MPLKWNYYRDFFKMTSTGSETDRRVPEEGERPERSSEEGGGEQGSEEENRAFECNICFDTAKVWMCIVSYCEGGGE